MAEDISSENGGGVNGDGGHPRRGGMTTHKGKSCKGCLYYSSLLKSDGRNPMCFGISRSLSHVPGYIVGETEMEATKEGRSLSEFKYACAGYSVFLDNKDTSSDSQENRAELPFCAGLELLVDRRTSTADSVPVHTQQKEDNTIRPQSRPHRLPHSTGEEFFSRFTRNAGLVASGVARNLNRVANYVKESLDDILYPYRRRPK